MAMSLLVILLYIYAGKAIEYMSCEIPIAKEDLDHIDGKQLSCNNTDNEFIQVPIKMK